MSWLDFQPFYLYFYHDHTLSIRIHATQKASTVDTAVLNDEKTILNMDRQNDIAAIFWSKYLILLPSDSNVIV
jgi:hypothetical protein